MLIKRSQNPSRSISALGLAAAFATTSIPDHAHAQREEWAGVLEEIIVTAMRVERNLQQTPMSVQAFTGESLELAGIDAGRDLGIMVPNLVANPGRIGERDAALIVRGLPGVTTFLDGFWGGTWGFLQRSFVELERVEVMRGPQGTHFGRNTNGGAIQLVTRRPADEFGARVGIELGEFNRQTLKLAVDVPISERLKTKWTLASDRNDGFLESQTAPITLGQTDNLLFRADILWQPTDNFSLRFTANEENRRSSDARIVRFSDLESPAYVALNVLAGNPDFLTQARTIDPAFPDPPLELPGDRFTPETHEPGFPGGTLGKWQTRSNIGGRTSSADIQFATFTINWDIGERWSLESMTIFGDPEFPTIWDRDASEFTAYTGIGNDDPKAATQELHFAGSHFNGRLQSLIGIWSSRREFWGHVYRWVDWHFAIPNTGPIPPQRNTAAVDYVRAWGATVGNPAVANYSPLTFLSADVVVHSKIRERALFGELTIGLLDRLDLTLGIRFTEDEKGNAFSYRPADAFRATVPGTLPQGDLRAVTSVLGGGGFDDLGTHSSPRVSVSYEPTDDIYLYASYAEGFTQGEIVNSPLVPDPIVLDPEVVETKELGLRSDWLGGRLRFNATYFDSIWDGLAVPKALDDPNNPGQPSPFLRIPASDGLGKSTGFEFELYYLPGERWALDLGLGFLDTEYLDVGDPRANGTGLQLGIPFAYAPEVSYSLGARYRLPLSGSGEMLFAGNYGWMDEYVRSSANELQTKNPDGSVKKEPAYGLLNARIIYRPGNRNWELSLFGTNLTDEWYVNGGEDAGLFIGYDFATIGRPREVGVGFQYLID